MQSQFAVIRASLLTRSASPTAIGTLWQADRIGVVFSCDVVVQSYRQRLLQMIVKCHRNREVRAPAVGRCCY